ncbi:MAG: sulfotransferase family 2 domain-containing protein [Bacteroidota bacterium]
MRLIKGDKANKNRVEIVSIHIPKTGGRSFHKVLKQIYGRSLDQRFEKHHYFPKSGNKGDIKLDLPKGIRGIHGHLYISQVLHIIEKDNPKVISWVRNPVDRVISNYYYFMKRIREGDTPDRQKEKENFSLLEYAAQAKRRNRMSAILSGIELDDFFFIGIMEQFEKDISELASLMGWTDITEIPHINNSSDFKFNNDCKTQYGDINNDMRNEVAALNENDIKLYKKIKSLRGVNGLI